MTQTVKEWAEEWIDKIWGPMIDKMLRGEAPVDSMDVVDAMLAAAVGLLSG